MIVLPSGHSGCYFWRLSFLLNAFLSGFETEWTEFHFYKMRTGKKNPNPLLFSWYSFKEWCTPHKHFCGFLCVFPVILNFPHIGEINPFVSSASMNSGSCGPQIAAVELFTTHLYMLQILIPDVQNHFQPRKLSLDFRLKDDFRSFSEMLPRDLHVSSVFGCKPPPLVLLPAVTQQVVGQREGKLRTWAKHACKDTAEWSGSVAQPAQRAEHQLSTDAPLWLRPSRSKEKPHSTSNHFTPVLHREEIKKPLNVFSGPASSAGPITGIFNFFF